MTHAARCILIVAAVQRHHALDRAFEPLIRIFRNHDFPLWEEAWKTYDTYLAAISREIGDPHIPGHGTWLHWFIYDNQCGRRAFEAKAASWKERRPIRTPRDLARLIEADLPRTP
jgi:hypothetical protein